MIQLAIAVAVGLLAGSRGRPKTRVEQKTMLGPRTGLTYDVEEFPEAGFLLLRTDGAHGVFQHVVQRAPGAPRFSWRGGKGPNERLHGMCLDLGIVAEPPAVAPPSPATSAPNAAPETKPSGPRPVPNPAKKTA